MKNTYREIERARRINEIIETLRKLNKVGKSYILKEFVKEICNRYGVTDRKAKEYIEMAEYKFDSINKTLIK